MCASRISAFPRRAAYILASMLLALLVLIADFLALEGPELFKGFSGLHLLGQLNWIVLDIAWNPALVLAAFAFLLY